MSWKRSSLLLVLSLAATGAHVMAAPVSSPARSGDPLQAPACVDALASLGVGEVRAARPDGAGASAARGARVPDPALVALRQHAARACLASRPDLPAPAGRFAVPPVGPQDRPNTTVVLPPPAAVPDRALGVLPALRPPTGPAMALTCDAVGCWGDDGSRLQRMGPNLWGPRGPCTTLGALVQCP